MPVIGTGFPLPDGYPTLEAYGRLASHPLQVALRGFADEFLSSNREALRAYAANWAADPLHHWSRRWEYQWVAERLGGSTALAPGADGSTGVWAPAADAVRGEAVPAEGAASIEGSVREGDSPRGRLRILDAGSGLTFFPHFLAQALPVERVECCDQDPAMERDARHLRSPASSLVHYGTRDLADIGFPDAHFDRVYCISVLEHTAERERIADEFARVLKPGGLLLVTMDVSLDGKVEIPREEAAGLLAVLGRRFRPLSSSSTTVEAPPADALTTHSVTRVAPELAPPRTYASATGILRRLARPRSFPWGKAVRRLLGGRSSGGASEVSVFCTAWIREDDGP